jgi:4-diphosphocytidyl-2-C-methyl-D-erythritol kinase
LSKQLPIAAGLGGGSADAAATLAALARLWELDSTLPSQVAPALGADVPVCLAGIASFVGGIGEQMAAAPALPGGWLVLANPGVPLPTATVFAERRGPFSEPGRWSDPIQTMCELAERLRLRRNDLTEPARRRVAQIDAVLAALSSSGAMLARMSGSGPTCFGLFADPAAARAAAATILADHPTWWVRPATMLNRIVRFVNGR